MGPEGAGLGFGRLVRGYRLAAGLTQEELAGRSGLSARAIADMERGRTGRPYPSSVLALAGALDLAASQREQLIRASRPAAGGGSMPGPAAAAPVARELPPAVSCFAGRAGELAALAGLLEDSRADGGAVVISAIAGTAGVGKTGLATHWAHQVAHLFPDGQLHVNLRGYDPGPPVSPAEALAGFLRALGVSGRDIPAETEERAGMYRSLLAGRRILIFLDNARDAGQVRPLLPGTASCLTVVTSRDSLAGLVARDGARRIELDALPLTDAVSLLRELVGARVEADPGAAAELAGLCCGLPLALRVTAELAAARPQAALAGLAAELSGQRARLELLNAGGDQATAVQTVFSWSDQQLDPAAARAFRLLGLHPGPDVDAHAMAALTATTPHEASLLLGGLARAHLIQPKTPGRYSMHDLLRQYATDRAEASMTVLERDQARLRLLDFLRHTAIRAEAMCQREVRSEAIRRYQSGDYVTPEFTRADQAGAWLRAERHALLAFLDQVTAQGQHDQVVALTAGLAHLLSTDGPFAEARTRHVAAVHAARHLGDQLGQAHALLCLGDARRLTGDYPEAARDLEQALALHHDLGDRLGQAGALTILGIVRQRTGDTPGAVRDLEQALAFYRDLGDRLGQAGALTRLGAVRQATGDCPGAVRDLEQALALCRDLGDRLGQAGALAILGAVRGRTGDCPGAVRDLEQALALYRDLGDRLGRANALTDLGAMRQLAGDYPGAARDLEQGLALFRDLGNRHGQANALTFLGTMRRCTGEYPGAVRDLEQALALFQDLGNRQGQANALTRLGAVRRLTGDYPGAARDLEQALAFVRDIGDRGSEAEALNESGPLHRVRGELAQAKQCHQQALELARAITSALDEASALAGLGRCAIVAGQPAKARALLRQAHQIFQQAGVAEAGTVLAELNALQGSRSKL